MPNIILLPEIGKRVKAMHVSRYVTRIHKIHEIVCTKFTRLYAQFPSEIINFMKIAGVLLILATIPGPNIAGNHHNIILSQFIPWNT